VPILRKCIKCNRELSGGCFDDNWRHSVNVCRDCKREQQREYRKIGKGVRATRLSALEKKVEELEAEVRKLRNEICPKCGGTGVVEVYSRQYGHTVYEDCDCVVKCN
jgi:DNA-directed RNA polymerase subunit M/transcription elongation factor TFIIS